MRNAGLEEAQAGIKISRWNINNFRYADDTTLIAESEKKKEPLDESERGEWKCWLKAQHLENEDHGIWSHHFMADRWGNSGKSGWLYFGGSKIIADGDCSHEIKRHLLLGIKVMTNLDIGLSEPSHPLSPSPPAPNPCQHQSLFQWVNSLHIQIQHIQKQRHYFANKGLSSQSYGFSRSHVWMWELDHKEAWALKNWCFQTVVLEKTLESPLDCKKIKPVHPKGNQHWMFVGRTDAKAEALILWSPYVEGHSLQKTLMLGKIEGKRRRGRGGWGGLIILCFQ